MKLLKRYRYSNGQGRAFSSEFSVENNGGKRLLKRCLIIMLALIAFCAGFSATPENNEKKPEDKPTQSEHIKWVDLNASQFALDECLKLDIKYHGSNVDFKFSNALAYLATKNGNNFNEKTDKKNLTALESRLCAGETFEQIMPDNKYAKYYLDAYESIFCNYVGDYKNDETGEKDYGLRCYFPLSKGWWYNHYDDFGNSRSFGFKRKHLGHDLMGSIGTPVISVESGTITECGWNRYGGWRIGVRSADTRRYYYYAHLRKDRPFAANLKVGDTVSAGQVIGYLGRTGYSGKENTNLQTGQPHLHFGIQLIYHPSQEKGSKEIWIDCYAITKFLARNSAKTVKDENKEFTSVNIRQWL